MIIIKSDSDLERMRASGNIAARIRDRVAAAISPGVTTKELGDYASELMEKHGAESAFYGYRGYPGQICASVNDAVSTSRTSQASIPSSAHSRAGRWPNAGTSGLAIGSANSSPLTRLRPTNPANSPG